MSAAQARQKEEKQTSMFCSGRSLVLSVAILLMFSPKTSEVGIQFATAPRVIKLRRMFSCSFHLHSMRVMLEGSLK